MDRNELLVVVGAFRSALQELARSGFFFQISISKNFPSGCCDDSSMLLAAYLTDMGFPGALRVSGVSGGRCEELCTHVWLRLDDLQIDITGSQFDEYNQPEILIAEQNSFLDTFKVEANSGIADFRVHLANDHRFLGYFADAYEAVLVNLPRRLA